MGQILMDIVFWGWMVVIGLVMLMFTTHTASLSNDVWKQRKTLGWKTMLFRQLQLSMPYMILSGTTIAFLAYLRHDYLNLSMAAISAFAGWVSWMSQSMIKGLWVWKE